MNNYSVPKLWYTWGLFICILWPEEPNNKPQTYVSVVLPETDVETAFCDPLTEGMCTVL